MKNRTAVALENGLRNERLAATPLSQDAASTSCCNIEKFLQFVQKAYAWVSYNLQNNSSKVSSPQSAIWCFLSLICCILPFP